MAPFVYEGDGRATLEGIYASICRLAAASDRELVLLNRLKILKEDGRSPIELKRVRLVAAMENQIPRGFQTRDEWPQWLHEADGIVGAQSA
eukprot:614802-Karenia_brevis.AAC.1